MSLLLLLTCSIVLFLCIESFSVSKLHGPAFRRSHSTRVHLYKAPPLWTDHIPPTYIVKRTDFDTSKFKSEMPNTEDILFLMHKHWRLNSGWYTGIELTLKHYFTRTRPISVTDTASILFYCGKLSIMDCRGDDLMIELHTKLFDVMFNDSVVKTNEFVEAMSGFGACHFQVHPGLNLTGWYGHFKSVLPRLSVTDCAVVIRAISQMGMDKTLFPPDVLEVLLSSLVRLSPEVVSPSVADEGPSSPTALSPSSLLSGATISHSLSSMGFEAIDLGNEVRAAVLQLTSNSLRSVCGSLREGELFVDSVMQAVSALAGMKFKKFDLDDSFQGALDQATGIVLPFMSETQLVDLLTMFGKMRVYWSTSFSAQLKQVLLSRLEAILSSVPSEQQLLSLLLAVSGVRAKMSDLPASMQLYVKEYFSGDRKSDMMTRRSGSSRNDTGRSDKDADIAGRLEQLDKWMST